MSMCGWISIKILTIWRRCCISAKTVTEAATFCAIWTTCHMVLLGLRKRDLQDIQRDVVCWNE